MTGIYKTRANYQNKTVDYQSLISAECDKVKDMLLEKNRKYGNSALDPKRIFSSADPIEQINVRIDDKLSRIASNQSDDTEDAELDLIGYLILKRVAKQRNNELQNLFGANHDT
jgi:hypothetical protein